MWEKTPIWTECNLILILPKRLGGKPFLLYNRCGQISWYVEDIFTKNVGLGTIYNS